METNCKFYELDLEAQKEAEEMAALFPSGLTGDEEAAYIEYMTEQKSADDPFANCGPFCKYFQSGNGYPGEYVYYCCANGNEHIIYVDFVESEII